MANKPLFADIHCHPNFKPYGQKFERGNDVSDPQPDDKISLWHELKPNGIDKTLSSMLKVAMYSQTDLNAAAESGVHIIGMSLGALEKEFITINRAIPKFLNGLVGTVTHTLVDAQNEFCNLVTRFGRKRLDLVRNENCYFDDLKKELTFIRRQENKSFQLNFDQRFYTFRIVNSGAMLESTLRQNEEPGRGSTEDKPITLCIALTMEGLHNLDAGNGASEAKILKNAEQLKTDFPLFFVTFTHHFWNGLCGHARSLVGVMAEAFNQDPHIGEGFNELGLKVLMVLLDKSINRRIPIDVKHMSYKARRQYFTLLGGNMPADLIVNSPELQQELLAFFKFNLKAEPNTPNAAPPVIVSHAAVNGYVNPDKRMYEGNFPFQFAGVESPFENPKIFDDPSINLYDDDLKHLGRFKCLIGIQLDRRRITGDKGFEISETLGTPDEDYLRYAYLVWNQVIHMVELWDLDQEITDAWDRICIGSDFDGLVNPLKGLERFSDYGKLREGLLHYCKLYFKPTVEFIVDAPGMGERGVIANRFQFSARNAGNQRLNPNGVNVPEHNQLSPDDIVEKICIGNAQAFMKTHFV